LTNVPAAAAWRQLPLPFAHRPHYDAADLLSGPGNDAALAWLARPAAWPQGRLALWGEAGSGKTHLLHVWAARVGAVLLAGPELIGEPAPQAVPLALDDADMARERPLLHLLNAAAEAGQSVLLAGRLPPARWPVALPDLASRLRAITAAQILPADDALLRALLARLLSERQLAVAEPVQDWLLQRLPRTPAAMQRIAARLDRVGLAAGRRVTRAVAAAALSGLAEDVAGASDYEDLAQPERLASSPPACLL
jgi:chromosomal replication initiation ATPase DnaA